MMVWPLGPAAVALVAMVTAGTPLLALLHARRMRTLAYGAIATGNPAAIAATRARLMRATRRHLMYGFPTVIIGAALLLTQMVACIVAVLPH